MKFITVEIDGLVVVEPNVFEDDRGYFYESYNKDEFILNGILDEFVQDNLSSSQKNVLRGLHFQKPPYTQAKLVRVIQGSVIDIAVDIRKKSSTYGEYLKIKHRYSCRSCGFNSQIHYWSCPSCHEWEQLKPVRGLEGE